MAKGIEDYNTMESRIGAQGEQIDKLVKDGTLTEEEGAAFKAELLERKDNLRVKLEDGDSKDFSRGMKILNRDLRAHDRQVNRFEDVETRAVDVLEDIDRLEEEGKLSKEGAEQARADVNHGVEDARLTLTDVDRRHADDYGTVKEGRVFRTVEKNLEKFDLGLDKVAADDAKFDAAEEEAGVDNGTSEERLKAEAEHLEW